jgi:PRC-barrel domain
LRAFGLQSTASLPSKVAMPNVKNSASTILTAFGQVQSDLIGKAVVLTDGKAGTVENVWLDELHGLRISIQGHDGKWPVSTIKFTQVQTHAGREKTRAAS